MPAMDEKKIDDMLEARGIAPKKITDGKTTRWLDANNNRLIALIRDGDQGIETIINASVFLNASSRDNQQ